MPMPSLFSLLSGAMKLPTRFTLTFTEPDRQKADAFCCAGKCLLATATKRRFPGHTIYEGVRDLKIGKVRYTHRHMGVRELAANLDAEQRPFYGKRVVGKKVVCTRV